MKVSSLPHIEGLTVEDLIEYARTKDDVKDYLPDEQDWIHLDRQWLGDVMYTLNPKEIEGMVAKARKERKEKHE